MQTKTIYNNLKNVFDVVKYGKTIEISKVGRKYVGIDTYTVGYDGRVLTENECISFYNAIKACSSTGFIVKPDEYYDIGQGTTIVPAGQAVVICIHDYYYNSTCKNINKFEAALTKNLDYLQEVEEAVNAVKILREIKHLVMSIVDYGKLHPEEIVPWDFYRDLFSKVDKYMGDEVLCGYVGEKSDEMFDDLFDLTSSETFFELNSFLNFKRPYMGDEVLFGDVCEKPEELGQW